MKTRINGIGFFAIVENLPGIALLATTLFGAYCIGYVGSYPITIFTLFAILSIALIVFHIDDVIKGFFANPFSFLMIIIVMVSFIAGPYSSSTALALSIMYLVFYACSWRETSDERQLLWLRRWQCLMNLLAIYGIYQFIGRGLGLPLTDLYLDGYMVKGYNWTNPITIGGFSFLRANALFMEPSFFSQYLAINILLYIYQLLMGMSTNSLKVFAALILNLIALIASFSGTGIIILILGAAILIFGNRKSFMKVKIVIPIAMISISFLIGLLLFAPTDVINYFAQRATEIFSYSENASSGYKRFNGSYQLFCEALGTYFIFGAGIGGVRDFVALISGGMLADSNNYVSNGFIRVTIDMGFLGIVCWIIFLTYNYINLLKNNKGVFSFACLLVIALNICHEAFTGIYFWIFLNFLNFKSTNAIDINERYKNRV